MGARQSKRSVDISGKEAEGGEVAGAGGEGRVERIADADALKPQLNGDAPHIEPQPEITEKEKILENGTSEKEEAITEKEAEGKDKEIVLSPVNGTNGEEAPENGDAKAQEAENNKKNKKEKIKKKWSFRSISFSKKDKQKPEKKQKEETNGDCEKVPEEAIDATPTTEKVNENASDDTSKDNEVSKEGQTPETPVTEPITNGSSAPETPKEEAAEVPSTPNPAEVPVSTEEKATLEPENLPINGLSINDPADDVKEAPAPAKAAEPVESKKEEVVATPVVDAPASEAPVATEVCVTKPKVEETAPPPLPDNPPPSSLTAFAATTMAPHLVNESVVDKVAIESPPLASSQPLEEPSHDASDEILSKVNTVISQPENDLTNPIISQLTSIETITDVKDKNKEVADFEAPELSVVNVSEKKLDIDANSIVESGKGDIITNLSDKVSSDNVDLVEGVENTSSVIGNVKSETELSSDLISVTSVKNEELVVENTIPVREDVLSAVMSPDILEKPPTCISTEASSENSHTKTPDNVADVPIEKNQIPLISENSEKINFSSETANEVTQTNIIDDKTLESTVVSKPVDSTGDSVPVLSNSPLPEPLKDNVDHGLIEENVIPSSVCNENQNIDLNIKSLETEPFIAASIDSPTSDLNPPSLLENLDSGSFPPPLESEENVPPTLEDFRSSLLDNAVSETDISDSFPPPPPPESCASESATELSVSESLPLPNLGSPVPESPQHSAQEPLEAEVASLDEAPIDKRPLDSAQPSQPSEPVENTTESAAVSESVGEAASNDTTAAPDTTE